MKAQKKAEEKAAKEAAAAAEVAKNKPKVAGEGDEDIDPNVSRCIAADVEVALLQISENY